MSDKPATTKAEMVDAVRAAELAFIHSGCRDVIHSLIQTALDLASRLPSPAVCAVEHGVTEAMAEAGIAVARVTDDMSYHARARNIYAAMERARVAAKGNDDG